MFKENDITFLEKKGIKTSQVNEQLNYFRNGFPVLNIVKPAVIGDGILHLDSTRLSSLQQLYTSEKNRKKIVKFVPASGAATRMFKALFEFLESQKLNKDTEEVLIKIRSFAFYSELKEILLKEGISPEESDKPEIRFKIVDKILNNHGLNYGNLPKGLLKFHLYDNIARTAFEEHLVEGAMYACGKNNQVNLHFTVSPEHRDGFTRLLQNIKSNYENQFGVKFDVGLSEQKSSTDTIAANSDNEPFRDKNGELLFRPGGHGALLDNLNEIDADIIFIKNIDNVVPDSLKETTVKYKNALAGLLLKLQTATFGYLDILESGNTAKLDEITSFINDNLGYNFPENFQTLSAQDKVNKVKMLLNRPIRVCGMVRNQGEPGGGPFWVKDTDGSLSLQILESSQFDLSNPEHKKILQSSTHFNPVDLVCSTKDKNGNSFNLHDFRDPQTGFISVKSKDGKELKALELPGLWNGSMAHWNTIFVEVPVETFNPVKTINDLLRPQHLAQ
jgi:hypothetical protein